MDTTPMMRIRYNSPTILTFSLLAVAIHLINVITPETFNFTGRFFAVYPFRSLWNLVDYFRLVSHVLGHANWQHLLGNITYILLLGPILEEKYGSLNLLIMICVTALITGLIHILLSSGGLLGASGIVFMLIILASIVDVKAGEIPLTFVLVACIFIGTELIRAFTTDSISQMAHIVGGASGALFGFVFTKTLNIGDILNSRQKKNTL